MLFGRDRRSMGALGFLAPPTVWSRQWALALAVAIAVAVVPGLVALPLPASGECIDYAGQFYHLAHAHLSASGRQVAASGNFLFVTTRDGGSQTSYLEIHDLSSVVRPGDDPLPRGRVPLFTGPDSGNGIAVSGGLVYVAGGPYGLFVVDISDVDAPRVVSSVPIADSALFLDVDGNHVYLTTGADGIESYDVSDPAHPVRVCWRCELGANDIEVEGDHAYVTSFFTGDLAVYDVHDPTNMIRVAEAGHPELLAWAVDVEGGHAYVGGGYRQSFEYWFGTFSIVDVRDPENPILESWTELPLPVVGVAVAGNAAYVTGETTMSPGGDLVLLDITDHAAPRVDRRYGLPEYGAGVCVEGNRLAYLQRHDQEALGISTAPLDFRPVSLGHYPGSDEVQTLDAEGDIVGVLNWENRRFLEIVDISNPDLPRGRGRVPFTGAPRTIDLNGSHAYVGLSNQPLQVIDISNPDMPVAVASMSQLAEVWRLHVFGSLLVAACHSGFAIVDISTPAHPELLSYTLTPDNAYDVWVDGNVAVVADISSLRVYDVQNPRAPSEIGSLSMSAFAVTACDGVAYVKGGASRIQVVDLADPTQPRLTFTVPMAQGLNMRRDGGLLYLISLEGVQVLDLSQPLSPYLRGEATLPYAGDIAVNDQYVLVGVSANGFHLMPKQCLAASVEDPAAPPGIQGLSLSVSPNPATGGQHVRFALPSDGRVRIDVFDPLGRLVARPLDGFRGAGPGVLVWDGRAGNGQSLPRGTYWMRVEAAGRAATCRITRIGG